MFSGLLLSIYRDRVLKKQPLRKHIIYKREQVSSQERQRTGFLGLKKFIPLLEIYKPKIIASYMPYHYEFDIMPINHFLQSRAVTLCYPAIEKNSMHDKIMDFRIFGEMEVGYKGIIQPIITNQILIPEMIICPFVGVSHNKARLGYGGGFYDKKIYELNSIGYKPILVGIGYDFQMLEESFSEEHDIIFDELLLLPLR